MSCRVTTSSGGGVLTEVEIPVYEYKNDTAHVFDMTQWSCTTPITISDIPIQLNYAAVSQDIKVDIAWKNVINNGRQSSYTNKLSVNIVLKDTLGQTIVQKKVYSEELRSYSQKDIVRATDTITTILLADLKSNYLMDVTIAGEPTGSGSYTLTVGEIDLSLLEYSQTAIGV